MKILVIDIGGSKVKVLASGQYEPRRAPSGRGFTPVQMVAEVQELVKDWEYDAVSIGYPGLVGDDGPRAEPGNLGPGWVGFNLAAAFDRPVRVMNDAAMQALGSYDGGRMLYVGLGTGLGSALIAEKVVVPLELGRLMVGERTLLWELMGNRGLKRLGKRVWRRKTANMIISLKEAMNADYVVIGGGNAKRLRVLPHGTRLGHNLAAFRGGYRMWGLHDVATLEADGQGRTELELPETWRLI